MRLNLARTLARSAVNGPGERYVLWVQGCPFACPGCWNPDTWAFRPRDVRDVQCLADEILATAGIEGVTFTGGEPFAQAAALAELARSVRMTGLSVFVFTGYERDALRAPAQRELLALADVVVTGAYRQEERARGLPWRGSRNQQVHFLTDRYGPEDMQRTPELEIHLAADGSMAITGFPDVAWHETGTERMPRG